jgi:hypothetical protein
MIEQAKTFRWPPPWEALDDEGTRLGLPGARAAIFGRGAIASTLADELQREVCSEHPLAGHRCTAVAFNREDENEFLFVTTNPSFPVAVVHLTWEIERRPEYPYTMGYSSIHPSSNSEPCSKRPQLECCPA